MGTPDYKTLLKGNTTWREEHCGVSVSLSHHGYRDGTEYQGASREPGTWCYYLHLTEQMFREESWKKLLLPERVTDWGTTHDYQNFPDIDLHGGCTFYEPGEQWDKHQNRKVQTIKIGCDYAHSWDRDSGYWQDYDAILRDAKNSVDLLLAIFPDRRIRCGYCGIWDNPDQFYEAVNGRMIHVSQKDEFDDGWKAWRPKEVAA